MIGLNIPTISRSQYDIDLYESIFCKLSMSILYQMAGTPVNLLTGEVIEIYV